MTQTIAKTSIAPENKRRVAVPETIGIIMDGNRRWARMHGLPGYEGHRKGYATLKECIGWAQKAGVKNVFLYAFSTENWRRSEEERGKLGVLLEWALTNEIADLKKAGVRIVCVGQTNRFGPRLEKLMRRAEDETREGLFGMYIGLSYGGRAEIVEAIRSLTKEERECLSEESFSEKLWTRGMPDPELIIRTGGEQRLSNFLLWQGAYAELLFTDTLWPDFSEGEFKQMLAAYARVEKRVGA